MNDRIKPALSAEDWATVERFGPARLDSAVGADPKACFFLVALNNAALPDDDPRKITAKDLADLYHLIGVVQHDYGDHRKAAKLAAKLGALLPPEQLVDVVPPVPPPDSDATDPLGKAFDAFLGQIREIKSPDTE